MTLALESTSSRMSRLARNAIVHGRQISAEEIEARFDAVDRAAVERLARELLAPESAGCACWARSTAASIRFSAVRAA